jgi:hypothetical protein
MPRPARLGLLLLACASAASGETNAALFAVRRGKALDVYVGLGTGR